MIEASFEKGADKSAWVTGAYQYDTGQRLNMYGLPTPLELAQADEFLSGDMVTMQVHFGLKGDTQTQARLALWHEEKACWVAAIPDECLQTPESVYAYVYVSYGMDEQGNGRTKTMYELVFKPMARPAPDHVVTGEQWEAWVLRRDEMDLQTGALHAAQEHAALAAQETHAAAQAAKAAAEHTQLAAQEAQQRLEEMEAIQRRWEKPEVRTVLLTAHEAAMAELQGGVLTLGLPRGKDGAKGETGDAGPADVAFSMDDGVLTVTLQAE